MVCVMPARVILLGEALHPVAHGVRQALTSKLWPSGHEFDTLEGQSRHLGVIQQALTRLKPRLDGLMTDVVHKEGASAIDAGKAAGRLEEVLSEVVDCYLDAKASHADGEASESRRLILGVYRHHITEICEWLEELVAVVTAPASAIAKRGMAAASSLELTVTLNLITPQEMAKLEAPAKILLRPTEVPNEASSGVRQHPGLLGTMGALAFGVGLAEAVFGRKHG
jgi:hypothetical protein